LIIFLPLFPVADPIKLFFFANDESLCFFVAKLGHFTISDFLYMLQNTQTKQQKSENEEKKFYRIGYSIEVINKAT